MAITITAFADSPDEGQGQARDMRVRWALEEAGQPYDVRLVSFREMREPAHRALHPFGQIPTYEEDGLALFESGAIVLHVAERHGGGLLPANRDGRARAVAWMFAALTTVEPPLVELEAVMLTEAQEDWYDRRLPLVRDRARARLRDLSERLGGAEWLDGAFSAGDLLMAHAVWRTEWTGLPSEFPSLVAYAERARARPAWARAFAAQRAVWEARGAE